jgi:hypothetical protein
MQAGCSGAEPGGVGTDTTASRPVASRPGPTDAGASRDASEAQLSPCSAGALYCDGFEQGLTHWTQTFTSGGAVTVDSTHVHGGTHALHAHVDSVTDAGEAYAYVQQIQPWPTHVFARVFVYQPSPFPNSPAGLFDLLQELSPYAGIEVLTDPPCGGLAMKTYGTGQDQAWSSNTGLSEGDSWSCLELEVDTSAEQTSHLYLNGTEVTDLTQANLGLPQLGIFGVGLSFYLPSPQGSQDAWIDDVVVSGARIGCAD